MTRTLINTRELVPGMYIDEIKCGLKERVRIGETKNFIISSHNEIDLIAGLGIQHVYVDPEKSQISRIEVADGHEKTGAANLKKETAQTPRTLEDEFYVARAILRKAHVALEYAINSLRAGHKIETHTLKPLLDEIYNSVCENKDAIVTICRKKKKDGYAVEHAISHCALMIAFGQTLGLDKNTLLDLGLGGLFQDVGNIRVPDTILNKPGKLTPEELEVVRKHPLWGGEILRDLGDFPESAIAVAMQHHERFDGTGYPNKLKENGISLYGQMASIVDVYDASISIRPYGIAGDPCLVIKNLYKGAGKLFPSGLVQQFIKTIGIYPVGTLARLESDKLGIVIKQTSNLTQPTVRIVYDLKHNCYLPPSDVDLSKVSGKGDKVVQAESPEKWKIDPFRFIFPELADDR